MSAEWFDKHDPDDFSPRPLLREKDWRNDPDQDGFEPNEADGD